MKRALLTVALFALFASAAAAQTPGAPIVPTPTTKIFWNHDGIQTDGYALIIDGARTVLAPAQVTCTVVNAIRECTTPFPALTPGDHILVVQAFNAAGTAESDPFPLEVIVKPTKPSGVGVRRDGGETS